MTNIIYHTPICYRCDRDKHPGGKSVLNDPHAIRTESGEWICDLCLTEMNLKLFGGERQKK
jgi:hypothetical protein